MTTATTPVPTWPTSAELERVESLVTEAQQAVDELNLVYYRLDSGHAGDPLSRPTYEELGRLTSLVEIVDLALLHMKRDLGGIRQAQRGAATMR